MQKNQSNLEIQFSFVTNETTKHISILKLKGLRLKSIEHSEIEKYMHQAPQDVKVINLGNNLLDEIPVSFMNIFTNLTRLYLDNNYIYSLPKDIDKLHNLITLAANNNFLSFLPVSVSRLPLLSSLLINNNKLLTLPIELVKCKELKRLYLHNNRFQNLPCIFHELHSIKEISLQWFAYLDPPVRRLIKYEGNGIDIIEKLKEFSKQTAQNHQAFFNFFQFHTFFNLNQNLIDNTDKLSIQGRSLLNQACAYGDLAFVEEIIQKKYVVELDYLNQYNLTPLAIAIRDDQLKLAKFLLKSGAKLNVDLGGCGNHLNIATMRMNSKLVKFLLRNGADPNFGDNEGNVSLHLIMSIFDKNPSESAQICEYLLKNKANPNIKNNDLWSPVHLATRRGQIDAIKWMILYTIKKKPYAKGLSKELFNFNKKGGQMGWTPLHLAVNSNQVEIVKLLLRYDVKLFKPNKENILARYVFTNNIMIYKLVLKQEILWMKIQVIQKRTKSASDAKTCLIGDFIENKFTNSVQNPNFLKYSYTDSVTILNPNQLLFASSIDPNNQNTTTVNRYTTTLHQSKEDLSNTLLYHSADNISQTEIDSSLNNSRNQYLQILNYTGEEKSIPKIILDIGYQKLMMKTTMSSENKRNSPDINNNHKLKLNSFGDIGISDAENITNRKGPKFSVKFDKIPLWKKQFKEKLIKYYKSNNDSTNLLGKIEQKAFLLQRKKILSKTLPFHERYLSYIHLKNFKNSEPIQICICSILEEFLRDEYRDDLQTDLLRLELLRSLAISIDSSIFTTMINLLKYMIKLPYLSTLAKHEIENFSALNEISLG